MTPILRIGGRAALRVATLATFSFLAVACSSDESKGNDDGTGGAPGTGGAGSGITADDDPEPTAEDFKCLTEGTKVQSFYVANRYGDTSAAEAVANDPSGGTYPAGTIIQLLPGEAMVKRYSGFAAETNDWEFFFLNVTAQGTEIKTFGTTHVLNAFNLNCLDCHQKAEPKYDFVCGKDHGCDPLPFSDSQIEAFQAQDLRCGRGGY